MDVEVAHPEVFAAVRDRLAAAGVPSPGVDARWLIEHVLADAAGASGPRPASGAGALPVLTTGPQADRLTALVARREAREPLQLVLGAAAFRTIEVACRPGVFIPRPETEVVAGVAIEHARQRAAERGAGSGAGPLVAEPCTGTGAIACAVALEVPGARVLATDLDPAAVDLARHNARALAPDRVEVVHGDLLDPLDGSLRGHLDVLVANPPYLPAADRGTWAPEVADHDPPAALIGGPDGHEVVDRLLALAADWLAPGGRVVLEIDERRGTRAAAAARAVGLTDVEVHGDLTGAERVLVARRPDRAGAAGR